MFGDPLDRVRRFCRQVCVLRARFLRAVWVDVDVDVLMLWLWLWLFVLLLLGEVGDVEVGVVLVSRLVWVTCAACAAGFNCGAAAAAFAFRFSVLFVPAALFVVRERARH